VLLIVVEIWCWLALCRLALSAHAVGLWEKKPIILINKFLILCYCTLSYHCFRRLTSSWLLLRRVSFVLLRFVVSVVFLVAAFGLVPGTCPIPSM
jgi:hypothetical protein